ncbi:MAG: EAL domain-containing protein [Burkholderiales bacterium]|nr:EAL domain-containing protein [Burkholderiales bacterium]
MDSNQLLHELGRLKAQRAATRMRLARSAHEGALGAIRRGPPAPGAEQPAPPRAAPVRQPELHLVTDFSGRILEADPELTAMVSDRAALKGAQLREFLARECVEDLDALLARIAAVAHADTFAWRGALRTLCAGDVRIAASLIAQPGGAGTLSWLVRLAEPVAAAPHRSLSELAFAAAADPMMLTDLRGRILAVNPAFARLSGYTAAQVVGKPASILRSGRHGAGFYERMWKRLHEAGEWSGEIWNRHADGEARPVWLAISRIADGDGDGAGYLAVLQDISVFKDAESRLHHLAHHDPLTGLPNRLIFRDRVTQQLALAKRDNERVAVLYMDLDRFKRLNDVHGHEAAGQGAAPGRRAHARLRARAGHRCAHRRRRVRGARAAHEEPPGCGDRCRQAPEGDAAAVRGRRARDLRLGEHRHRGVSRPRRSACRARAVRGAGGRGGEAQRRRLQPRLLARASPAERRLAGDRGRARPRARQERARAPLPAAGRRRERPHLGCRGAAALAPSGARICRAGRVYPHRRAHRQDRPHRRMGSARGLPPEPRMACGRTSPVRIAVNVSSRQLEDPSFVRIVERGLAEGEVPPELLELEITETDFSEYPRAVLHTLARLGELGVKIAIDDFGIGYSSLDRIRKLPVGKIKIDQSFVHDLLSHRRSGAITAAIISLAEALHLDVIAEGVESEAQYRNLLEKGCAEMQGYFFGRPMSAAEFSGRLRAA